MLLIPHLPRKIKVHVTKCHQSQPSAISATPTTQRVYLCSHVSHLPRRMHVHTAKFHICHVKRRGVHGVNWDPSAPPEPAQCHKYHATQSDDPSYQVPHLSRKVQVHVTKCHACQSKSAVSTASIGTQTRHQSQPSAISAIPAI